MAASARTVMTTSRTRSRSASYRFGFAASGHHGPSVSADSVRGTRTGCGASVASLGTIAPPALRANAQFCTCGIPCIRDTGVRRHRSIRGAPRLARRDNCRPRRLRVAKILEPPGNDMVGDGGVGSAGGVVPHQLREASGSVVPEEIGARSRRRDRVAGCEHERQNRAGCAGASAPAPACSVIEKRSQAPDLPKTAASVPERKPQLGSSSAQPGPADMVVAPEAEASGAASAACGASGLTHQTDTTVSLNVPAGSGLRRPIRAGKIAAASSAEGFGLRAVDGPLPALMRSRRKASVAARRRCRVSAASGWTWKAPPAGSSIAKTADVTSSAMASATSSSTSENPRHDRLVRREVIEPASFASRRARRRSSWTLRPAPLGRLLPGSRRREGPACQPANPPAVTDHRLTHAAPAGCGVPAASQRPSASRKSQ